MLVRTLREFAPTIGAAPTELAFVPSATVRVILLDSLRRAHKCCSGVTARARLAQPVLWQAALNCVIDSVELAPGDDVLSLDIGYH
jgi:hypothetical protein